MRKTAVFLLVTVPLVAACDTEFDLPPANLPVAEQQINLYALSGTPVHLPSAYNMLVLVEVRTDRSSDFDFAFEIAPDSVLGVGTTGDTVAALLPRAAVGFNPDGGLQTIVGVPWDSILLAPETGYDRNRPHVISTGQIVLAASRLQQCDFGLIRPRYAKMFVENIDYAQRRATIRVIIDPNCGYRSLAPGIPTR